MTGGFDPDEHVFGSSWGLAPQTAEDSLLAPGPLDTPEGDRYVSTGLIGAGGMGVVDAVLDRRLGQLQKRCFHPPARLDPPHLLDQLLELLLTAGFTRPMAYD